MMVVVLVSVLPGVKPGGQFIRIANRISVLCACAQWLWPNTYLLPRRERSALACPQTLRSPGWTELAYLAFGHHPSKDSCPCALVIPLESRRRVVDFVAAGRPVAESLPIWPSPTGPSTTGSNTSRSTPASRPV